MHSAIYEGWVRHRRRAPVRNDFRPRLYLLYLDLEELPSLFDRRALWSATRPNVAWFRRADYLGNADEPLDESVRALVEARTGARPTGPIRMLTQLRTFGYVFNPVSFYYCFDAAGARVETIVAEITNTPWFERHAYVLPRSHADVRGRRQRFEFPKTFHVSPFMEMAVDYDWLFTEPGERLSVHMACRREGLTTLDATLALRRSPLGARSLARVLLRHPLITFKTTGAIYWQAMRLWWKRCPFVPHPDRERARAQGVTHVDTDASQPHPVPARSQAHRPRPPASDRARHATHH